MTDQPCAVYRLSAEALQRMEQEAPDLALALHRFMVCLLAERLASSSKTLRSVLE